ncbi:MAG: alpha/beta hydrolase [Actinomycetota bacterium]|nr:alpha/beta hydrolase [Actinomycetota bacterium]MEE3186348.1 alpha/beta hydrolase [Actinomycetota bacterium]
MPYLNEFSPSSTPLDMTGSAEFSSLCESANDLGIQHSDTIRYVSTNVIARHQRFHLLEWGDPTLPTLLLLHGGNQSAHSWDLVSLHLADRFHILALDQRGHGDSEWARDADYSSNAMASDASAVLEELNVASVTVIGHSMGGMNTMRLAVDEPHRSDRIVLVDIGPELSDQGTKSIRSFVTENREFDDIEHFVQSVQKYDPYRSREHIERTVKYNLLQRADGKYVSKRDHGPRLATTRTQREQSDLFSLQDAASITQPTLLIRGADSNVLTADAAQRFADALPNGQLVTVPDSGHNVHGQNTVGFLQALVPFLND